MREVPKWSEYFIKIAQTVAIRSKDPRTQVGAVVVDKDNHIIGTGYNGFHPKINETDDKWDRPRKYDLVIHAEMNALAHSTSPARGGKIYVTLHPCVECAKLICASGITSVFYLEEKGNESEQKAKELLELSSITLWKVDI